MIHNAGRQNVTAEQICAIVDALIRHMDVMPASCAAAFFYMMKKYPVFCWNWNEFTFEWTLAKQALKSGFPMALQQFIVSIGIVFIQRAVNSYSEAMTASFTVAQKVETYKILPANALMTTQGIYAGQNIGAGRIDRIITGAKHTLILSEIISICILIMAFVFAEPIVTAFGLEAEAINYCTAHVRYIAICLIPFASYFPLLGMFRGQMTRSIQPLSQLRSLPFEWLPPMFCRKSRQSVIT